MIDWNGTAAAVHYRTLRVSPATPTEQGGQESNSYQDQKHPQQVSDSLDEERNHRYHREEYAPEHLGIVTVSAGGVLPPQSQRRS